jgi:adenosylhomocysteine nucleosidase
MAWSPPFNQQYIRTASGCNTQSEMTPSPRVLVLISANAEWKEVRPAFPAARIERSPYGEYFLHRDLVFFHGGWGKISASASAEHAITRWRPSWIVNLGTCGGVAGQINRYDIVLANKTVVYDIIEQMGDSQEAIDFYSSTIDNSWVPASLHSTVVQTTLFSADRDLVAGEIPALRARYGARAVDWESGAIAWVAARHRTRSLILRGVTDLVGAQGGEAYGKPEVFASSTALVMKKLLDALPAWVAALPR